MSTIGKDTLLPCPMLYNNNQNGIIGPHYEATPIQNKKKCIIRYYPQDMKAVSKPKETFHHMGSLNVPFNSNTLITSLSAFRCLQ